MKRREFLIKTGWTGVALPVLARAAVPCPPPSVSVSGGTSATTPCTAGSAMSDWLARIGGSGVVWYNGFQSQAEVDLYRWGNGIGNDPGKTDPQANLMAWNSTGGPGGTFPYLSITRNAGSTETNPVWWRPYSPFTGASNGRGTDDPAAGGTIALQTWAPQGNVNETNSWTAGWYSNNSALNPDGVDFYVQIRVKMDPNASAPGMVSPAKLLEHGIAHNTLTAQNLVTYLNGSQSGTTNYHRMYCDGSFYSYGQAGYVSSITNMSEADPSWITSYDEQEGSALGHCNLANIGGGSVNNCWAWSGGWDTILYHITPGTVALTGPHAGTVCHIQVWAAHQGETAYTKIRDQQYELAGWDAPGREGYQALYLGTYSNNLNQPLGFTSRYTQIIFSKQFIPCPQV